jgi:Family of unknown function (DUF6011)
MRQVQIGGDEMAVQMTTKTLDGFYTVIFQGGYRTFRVSTNDEDASFAPGKQVIAFLGRDAEYVSFAFVIEGKLVPWKRFRDGYKLVLDAARFLIEGDMERAGKMYAKRSGNCWRCGRVLTTPQSIADGIGPVCASKL